MNGDILERLDRDAQALPHFLQFLLHSTPEGIRITVEKNRLSASLDGEFFKLRQRIALTKNQARTNRLKIRIQGPKGTAKEVLAVRPRPTMVLLPVAQNINRKNLRPRRRSGMESGIVRKA